MSIPVGASDTRGRGCNRSTADVLFITVLFLVDCASQLEPWGSERFAGKAWLQERVGAQLLDDALAKPRSTSGRDEAR